MIADLRNGKIFLPTNNDTYVIKDQISAIPTARWNAGARAWTYEPSPFVLMELSRIGVDADSTLTDLSKKVVLAREAKLVKTSGSLPAIPKTKLSPWHHQLVGYHFADKLDASGLFLDMGCGKTKVAIDLITNSQVNAVLIMCPKYVVDNWQLEFGKHAVTPFAVFAGTTGSTAKRLELATKQLAISKASRTPFVMVVNYDAIIRANIADFIKSTLWDYLILDEGHRLKAPGSKRSMSVYKDIRPLCGKAIALTGTPMPRDRLDAYGLYRALDKGIFGSSFVKFRTKYADVDEYGRPRLWKNETEFLERFFSIAYRVEADEVLDLPDATEIDIRFMLGARERRIYDEMEEDLIAEYVGGKVTAANGAVKTGKVRQIANGFISDDGNVIDLGDSKIQALAGLLQDIGELEPFVVFCVYHADMNKVERLLTKLKITYSEVSGRAKDAELEEWKNGQTTALVAQIDSIKEGVDCTRSHYGIFYSRQYTPGAMQQAHRRLNRPGQTKPVTYYNLVAVNTVDVAIGRVLKSRQKDTNFVLGSDKNEVAELMENIIHDRGL